MDLIVAGKSVDGDDDEDDDNETKKKKKHHHHHKKDSDDEDEEEEDNKENDDDDDDFQEVEEDNKKQPVVNQPKPNANLFDFTSSDIPVQKPQQAQIQNNIFNVNGNINIHNNNFQQNPIPQKTNANNGNLLDVFTEETQQDIKAKDLLSSIQQAYTNPQQSTQVNPSMSLNSARPNMSNNLYNTNQNNFFNRNPMANNMNMNAMNMNTMNSMYMNNNMYMNNMSSGYGQQSRFNMNYNNSFGYENNYQKPQPMNTPFNIDLYNKNKEPQTQRGGSTSYHLSNDYDFSLNNLGNKQPKKNNDPFSNLVSFK